MSVGEIPLFEKDRTGKRFLDETGRTFFAVVQMVADGIALLCLSYVSLSVAIVVGHHNPRYVEYYSYLFPTIATAICMVFLFARAGVYDVFNDSLSVLRSTLKYLLQMMLVLVGCLFVAKLSDDFSRIWLASWLGTSVVVLTGFRLITARAGQRLVRSGRLTRNIAVVGANGTGQRLAAELVEESLGTRLVGLFDDRRSRIERSGDGAAAVQQLSALDKLLNRGWVDEVVIAIPPTASARIRELSRRYHPFPVSLRILAPSGYEQFQVLDSRRYGDIGTFRIMSKPLDEAAILLKRVEDVVIALFGLLLTLPLMLLIALAIKVDSRGPVFFKQKRLGANNQPFDLLKFRSMYEEQADLLGHQLTRAGDPRITRVGSLLRRTSMDELPQLINVLRGDMSLVGPRPIRWPPTQPGCLCSGDQRIPDPPSGKARHNGLGAGQWMARRNGYHRADPAAGRA